MKKPDLQASYGRNEKTIRLFRRGSARRYLQEDRAKRTGRGQRGNGMESGRQACPRMS